MTVLTARLRVYDPNGSLQGSLPHPLSWEMSNPLNDVSSITISYPTSGAWSSLLLNPCEVALELMNPYPETYTEYPNCRFLVLRRQSDLSEDLRAISVTMPGYGWQLRKVRLLRANALNKEGRREFKDATPGQIIKAFIDEAKDRGNIPGLAYDFSSTEDSSGNNWPIEITADFDFGQDAWSALDALARQGLVDWRFNGRTLEMYVAGTTLARNLATDSGVMFHPHVSHIEEPADRTLEDLAQTVLVIGDKGKYTIRESSSAITPWGQWEEVYQAGGVKDANTLHAMATRILQTRERARIEYTKQLAWQYGLPVPLAHYRPGDYVLARNDSGGQRETMRIHQVTLNQAEDMIFTTLTLNDRFTERALRNERWLNRISGNGGPGEGGGSGGIQTPVPQEPLPTPEDFPPSAPQGLVVTSKTYVDGLGNPVGRAECTWDPVTTNTNGDQIEPDRYQLAARRTDLPPGLEILASVKHPTNTGFLHPLDGGYDYRFQVRAVSVSGRAGDWSNEVILRIDLSDIPPPKPSPPILSTKLGTVKVEWDGLTDTGTPMPLDFTEVQVEMSTTGAAPWTRIGEIFEGGSAVIATGLPIGVTRWFRFIAKNSSHLFSTEPSDEVSIVVQGVRGPDIAAGTITANNIAAGTITAEQIAAYSINVDRLSIGDISNMVADPLLGDSSLNANRVLNAEQSSAGAAVWSISGGVATVTKGATAATFNRFPIINNTVISGSFQNDSPLPRPGLAIQVTRPTTTDGVAGNIKARFRVALTQGSGTWTDNANVSMLAIFYNQYGVMVGPRVTVVSGVNYAGAGGGLQESVSGVPVAEGASFMVPYIYIQLPEGIPANATVSLSEFELWQEASVYIGDGRITAPLIQANAISTDKLAANAITAKHTIQSAHYIMTSVVGDTTLQIMNSANYVGQAGLRWEGPAWIEASPRIFMVDEDGTGGWDANGLVLCAPETTLNDSGRVDIQLAHGITNTFMKRSWGPNTQNQQGIVWSTSNAQFRINGQLPSNNFTNDMFRGVNFTSASNANVWSLNWGSPNFLYFPVCTPAFANAADSTNATDATCLVTRRSENGMRVTSSRATNRMHILAFTGGSSP